MLSNRTFELHFSTRSFGLIDVIQGLIFLLYQPNLSDPISSFFNSKNTNDDIFRKNVYTSLHGGTVDGIDFLPNPGICENNEIALDILKEDTNVVNDTIIMGKEDETDEEVPSQGLLLEKENTSLESKDEINTLMTNNVRFFLKIYHDN